MNEIQELKIDTSGVLTADVKKHLVTIIEGEFRCKDSLFHQIQQKEKDKILDSYRKSVKYAVLKRKYDKLMIKRRDVDDEINKAGKDIANKGLNVDGSQAKSEIYTNGKYVVIESARELQKLLKTVEANAPSKNLKNKLIALIARLMLSTTIGEANAIMRAVLGNGIIQKTDLSAITFQAK